MISMNNSLPIISVIIATKNEERNIKRCITSIFDQTYPSELIEIVVVDNASSDKTREIACEQVEKVFNFQKEIDLSKILNYRGAQVNFGVMKARGEVIFFPDADMTFTKNLFVEIAEKMKESAALYIPETIVGHGFFGRVRDFERGFYNGTVVDGLRVCKKDVFTSIGGFDERQISFGFDDWDLTRRIKEKVSRTDMTEGVIRHHEEVLTLSTYLQKKTSYIGTSSKYINKWGKYDPEIRKQFGWYYRFIGIFIENKKWVRLLRHPILTIGMYGVRCAVGFRFIVKSIRS